MGDSNSPWWVLAISGAFTALGVYLNVRGGWLATRAGREDKAEDREAAERAAVRNSLDQRQTAWMDRIERENETLRKERDQKDGELADLREYAVEMRHGATNARQVAETIWRMMPEDRRGAPIEWAALPAPPAE